MKHVVLPLVLGALAGLTGCAPAALATTGLIVSSEFQDHALTATVEEGAEVVWASVKSTLGHMTNALVHTDEDQMMARTKIDGAVVRVQVRTWDVREAQVRVAAKKYMLFNREISEIVQRGIVKGLDPATDPGELVP